ncbi:hypothetical protein HWV62_45703 [Athelia sp. TMB]|nr:hypothetical protein HWV62_45703 [Athelia sp. TMB]
MGNVSSSVFGWLVNETLGQNPTFEDVEAHERAERARRKAEETAKHAKAKQAASEEAEKAARQEAQRAHDAAEQAKAQQAASEEAEKAARQEAQRAQEAAKQAKAKQEASEKAEQAARQEAHRAKEAAEQADTKWRKGIRPVVWPTLDELQAAKERIGYVDGLLYFAVAGNGGSGKSSLINALRGMTDEKRKAAPTGIMETTKVITRYRDPNRSLPFMWCDMPGAGSLAHPSWQYFNEEGLYIFDCIIVLFDARFMETDIAILQNCARYNIPAYIVRSKSDHHVANVLDRIRGKNKKEKTNLSEAELRAKAREEYADQTRTCVERDLKEAELPLQRVYLVSKNVLCHLRKTKTQIVPRKKKARAPDEGEPLSDSSAGESDESDSDDSVIAEEDVQARMFDEEELLEDILADAKNRRLPKQKDVMQLYNKFKGQMARVFQPVA